MINTNFKEGDRVIVISSCQAKGQHGRVYSESDHTGYIGVKLDKDIKKRFLTESLKYESEDNRMAKLSGFNKVAVIEQGTGYNQKDYFYALYDDNIYPGDKVLASGSASGLIWTVKDVFEYDETIPTKNITAEVICKVDTSAYDKRCANRKKAEELRKQMDKKRKEIEARKDDEYYASLDSEYAEMLTKMKEMVG